MLTLNLGSTLAAFVAQAIFLSDPGTMVQVFKTTRGGEGKQQQQTQSQQRDVIQLESTATRRNPRTSNQTTQDVSINLEY